MTSPSTPSSVSYLASFQRPIEIYHCIWDSASNVLPGQSRKCPHDCACSNLPNDTACQDGYIKMGQFELGASSSQHQRTQNPNELIKWCLDPQNMDPRYKNDNIAAGSWVAGCINGIRGYHKIYHDKERAEPCEKWVDQFVTPSNP